MKPSTPKTELSPSTQLRSDAEKAAVKGAKSFFQTEVADYIVTDIKKLSEIRPKGEKGLGGCTIPQALMIFAVLDYLGYLIRDDTANPKPTDTKGAFRYMLCESNYFPKEYCENYDKIVRLFRHGCVHQVFPKAAGISKAGPRRGVLYVHEKMFHLNVDVLTKDALHAITQISEEILHDRNEGLALRIGERLQILNKADYAVLAGIK